MVMHRKRVGGAGSTYRMIVNGIGAVATGLTLLVVLVAEFRWCSASSRGPR
jgi:hypothetical protein